MRRRHWLPRVITAGFAATVVMTFAFFTLYGAALYISWEVIGGVLKQWSDAMARNPVTDLAGRAIYVSLVLHLTVGLAWALVYAVFAEPRLSGAGWLKGSLFSLSPWVLSLVVFLPLLGGGFLGLGMGAGPLPAIGSLLLHLAYGVTLGAAYGEREPMVAPTPEVDSARVERSTASGVVLGALLGAAAGALLVYSPLETHEALGLPVGLVLIIAALIGGAWGALVGSMLSLPGRPLHR